MSDPKLVYNRVAVMVDLQFVHETGWPKIPEDHRIVNGYMEESVLKLIVEGPSLPQLTMRPGWSYPMVGWDLKPLTGDPRTKLWRGESDDTDEDDTMSSSGARPELEICPAGHRAERHIEAGCLHCFADGCKYAAPASDEPKDHLHCRAVPYPSTVATDVQGGEEE